MQKELGKEYHDQEARVAFLRDNCDGTEEKGYMKPFSPDQMAEKKEDLANVSIKIAEIEDEKKASNDNFKHRQKPLNDQKNILLMEIKNKSEYIKEEVFKFVDPETRWVGYYNSEGNLIDERPAYGDELQGTIFQLQRAAK